MFGRPPINRQLLGLLGLLDIQNNGRSPGYIDDAVMPQLDVTKFLLAQPIRFTGTGSFAALGSNVSTLAVPNGEAWIVPSFVVAIAALGAGDTIHGCPAVFGPAPNNQLKAQGEATPFTYGTPDTPNWRWGGPNDWFIAGPGEQFGAVAMQGAGFAFPFSVVVWAISVKI